MDDIIIDGLQQECSNQGQVKQQQQIFDSNLNPMSIQKRQTVQKAVIDQAGLQRLILNDMILGFEGAQTVAQLIPQYHPNLLHLEIKGNNIDSEGFEVLFSSLLNCPNLKSIEAEWNSIGTSPSGLELLVHLVRNLQFLQFIDLKNNRISHQLAPLICEIIESNNRSLKVLDLRWNELGEIGAQSIYRSLAYNSNLKYIGLEDNRISMQSLRQIEEMMKNVTRGTKEATGLRDNRMNRTQPAGLVGNVSGLQPASQQFPLSQTAYPSMELQLQNAQLRAKIENEQNEAEIYHSKLKLQIDKTLQKLKTRGLQMHEYQLKFDSLNSENLMLINQLREAERMLALEKERFTGTDKGLGQQKSELRKDKYNLNLKIQAMSERVMQKNQREIEELEAVMGEKASKLEAYYRDRVNKKRANREKLVELREDIIKLELSKENAWDRITQTYQNSNKNSLEEKLRGIEELVAKSTFQMKSQTKTSTQLSQKLSTAVLQALQKEQKMEAEIFSTQNTIKDLHNSMGVFNVEIQEYLSKAALLESQTVDKESAVEMRRKYIKYLQSQAGVNLQIERLKQEEDLKGERLLGQTIETRVAEVEKAIRAEQAQNKMIRNQYDKLKNQLEAIAKKTVQEVLFEV